MRKQAELQRDFFDALAKNWRVGYPIKEEVFCDLFSDLDIENKRVLDVACGTGVLSGYLAKRAKEVVAIDVSGEMIARAKKEVCAPNLTFAAADFYEFNGQYDYLFVFDAYPHFTDRALFAERASALLSPGGYLVIAFDESKKNIDARHERMDETLSLALQTPEKEAENFSDFSLVKTRDDERYLIVLKKRG